jgi:peptidyl-prolyl cis-trans isomerase D
MLSRFLKIRKGRVNKAKMAGTSLEAMQKRFNSATTDVTMQNQFNWSVGREPKVVGNAFALDANKLSSMKEIQVCML